IDPANEILRRFTIANFLIAGIHANGVGSSLRERAIRAFGRRSFHSQRNPSAAGNCRLLVKLGSHPVAGERDLLPHLPFCEMVAFVSGLVDQIFPSSVTVPPSS